VKLPALKGRPFGERSGKKMNTLEGGKAKIEIRIFQIINEENWL